MKKIIINCDDGFYSEERDLGIVHGLANRSITDVSVMMNGYVANNLMNNIESSVLYNYFKKYSIIPGLHLNLTEGTPLKDVKSFVNEYGIMLGKFEFPEQLKKGAIDLVEIELEITAQFERFEALFHNEPTHVDGHQHFHVLPGIINFLCRYIASRNIEWIRIPNEILNIAPLSHQNMSDKSLHFYHSVISHASRAAEVATLYNLRFPKFFGISVCGQKMTYASLYEALSRLDTIPPGSSPRDSVVELMTHPGYRTTTNQGGCSFQLGPDEFSRSLDREHELRVLGSDEVKEMWKDMSYQLTSFQQMGKSNKSTILI